MRVKYAHVSIGVLHASGWAEDSWILASQSVSCDRHVLGWGGPIVQRSSDGRGLIFPRVLSYVHCEPMRGRGAEIRIYHTYCGRGRISPRFRGKYIVLAIRHTSGREAILVRVKGAQL